MMKPSITELEGIVNASGFMLQLAVENTVAASRDLHGFDCEAREHPWRSADGSGFIDLIFGRNTVRLVCECKRTRDANWVFAVDDTAEPQHRHRARLYWTHHTTGGLMSGWFNFGLSTESPESSFCMIRGAGENDKPLLERMASTLISSVEALAAEEVAIRQSAEHHDNLRVYVPLIITTAKLWVCRYDPSKIDLATGVLSESTFEAVPTIRFRKALTAATAQTQQEPNEMPYRAFRRISREQERTILVVNASALVDLLTSWRSSVVSPGSGTPLEWRVER